MSVAPLNVLAVVGSLHEPSVTRAVILQVAERLREAGCAVDVVDLRGEPLPLFNPDSAFETPVFAGLKPRVERAEAFVLGTPDYHGSVSSTLKNFLDHFWREFSGKLFGTIVASHEKGLTVMDQVRTIARQCYAWSLPYGLSVSERDDLKDGRIISNSLQSRIEMFVRDLRVYGSLLAAQRRLDLSCTDHCFMARLRPK